VIDSNLNGGDMAFIEDERGVVAQEDQGDLLAILKNRYDLTMDEASEIVSLVQEHTSPIRSDAGAAMQMERMVRRGATVVIDSRTSRELAIKFWCFCLSMNWFDIIDGVTTSAELGRKLGLTKQDINKFANKFRDVVADGAESLPPTSGQRDDKTRSKFGKIRLIQQMQKQMKDRVETFIKEHPKT
jgi:hypothetical protein